MSAAAMASAASFSVDRVDPPHWWAGMHSPSLQLQVHGSNVRPADFSVSYPGVTVDSVVRLDGSPDWQYVYLSLTPDVKPGEMKLQWKEGRKTVTRAYELRERRPMKGAAGFSAADLLYLVMPDRFADGDTTNNRVASMRFPVGADRSDPNTRHGGDIAGLMRHLDYIDSLGVTAVWVNPVLDNDMPGGFPGDTVSVFTSAGRTPMQREAYDFISRLAGWRKGSRAVAEGSMLHFMPDNGVYLYVRRAGGDEVVVVLNGRDVPNEVDMSRYASAIPSGQHYSDVLTGAEVILRPVSDTITLAPRQIHVLQPIK